MRYSPPNARLAGSPLHAAAVGQRVGRAVSSGQVFSCPGEVAVQQQVAPAAGAAAAGWNRELQSSCNRQSELQGAGGGATGSDRQQGHPSPCVEIVRLPARRLSSGPGLDLGGALRRAGLPLQPHLGGGAAAGAARGPHLSLCAAAGAALYNFGDFHWCAPGPAEPPISSFVEPADGSRRQPAVAVQPPPPLAAAALHRSQPGCRYKPAPKQPRHSSRPPPAAPARSPAACAPSTCPCAAAAPPCPPAAAPSLPCAAASCRAAARPCPPRCCCCASASGAGAEPQAALAHPRPQRRPLPSPPAAPPRCRSRCCRSRSRCWTAAACLPPPAAAGLQQEHPTVARGWKSRTGRRHWAEEATS